MLIAPTGDTITITKPIVVEAVCRANGLIVGVGDTIRHEFSWKCDNCEATHIGNMAGVVRLIEVWSDRIMLVMEKGNRVQLNDEANVTIVKKKQ